MARPSTEWIAGLLRCVRQQPLPGAVRAPTEVAVVEGPFPPLETGRNCPEDDRENDRAAMVQGCHLPSEVGSKVRRLARKPRAVYVAGHAPNLCGEGHPVTGCPTATVQRSAETPPPYSTEGMGGTLRPRDGTLLRTQRLRHGSQFLAHPSLNGCTNKSVPPRRKMWA